MIEEILAKADRESRNLKTFRYLLFAFKTEELENKKPDYKSSAIVFTKKEATKIKKEVEAMEKFDGWKNFGDTWDVLWAGLYVEIDDRTRQPKEVYWRPGFHGPDRRLVTPVSLVVKNNIGRMETTFDDTRRLFQLEIPEHLQTALMRMERDVMEDQMIGEVLPGGDGFAAAKKEQMRREEEERKKRELQEKQRQIEEELKKMEE